MNDSIISVRNVSKIYNQGKTKVKALDNVSLDIKPGELTVITGYSGSGKTTLLNAISSLIDIDTGSIIVSGKDITKFKEKEKNKYRKENVSIIFQNYNLLEDLTVYENILLCSKLNNIDCNINKLLKLVDLTSKKDNYPNELSGGEKQRVSIIRSIAKGGSIYLCDEPTGALDVANGKTVLTLLKDLAKEENKCVIIITHNDLVTLSADHIIVMKDGKIVEDKYNDSPIDIDKVNW